MKKLLVVTDVSFSNNANGPMNTLKNFLSYVPADMQVTVISDTPIYYGDNIENTVIDYSYRINILRKIFMSVNFSSHNSQKDIVSAINDWGDNPILLCTSSCNVYRKYCNGANVYLIITDLPTIAYRKYIVETNNILKKAFYIKEYLYCSYYEKLLPKLYRRIVLVNEKEAEEANNKNETNRFVWIPVVYKKVDCIFEKCRIDEKINLVFIGNMTFTPNENGIKLFYNKVFSKLNDKFHLHLIGKESEKFFKNDKRVKTYGFVDDLGELVSKMDYGICFMRDGGGMKNKIFDYMKYGIPCIINRYCMLSNYIDSDYVFVADDVKEFLEVLNIGRPDPEKIKKSIEKYEVSNVASKFWKVFEA
ncbi:glycosyltransferase [Butyrivibrio sp. WCE2006]|uniref:glycosyltransferase n=1 Tax=Butyrivibrio sp. WCE2006 TaxID=1410611 RepID=UPI0005D18F55|nr:glycosyltransferase family 4 protein [Butyrivibrio sp. WCE2006]